MSEGMLGNIPLDEIRRVGGDLLVKLGGNAGQKYFEELKKFGARQPCWVEKKSGGSKPLLESGDNFTLPAVTLRQSVGEAFAGCHLYGNFEKWFGKCSVEPQGQVELVYGELTRPSQDIPILGQLFGRHETTLATVATLIKAQINGEYVPLLTNGYANIFYIRDTEDELRAVGVYRGGRVWHVVANSVSHGCDWDAGDRVFSR